MAILPLPGPGLTAHNAAYVAPRAAIGKEILSAILAAKETATLAISSRSGHLDILAAIPQERRGQVLAQCGQRRYRKGETIWRQGEAALAVGILAEGKAVSEYRSSRGRSVITGLWATGDLVGALHLGAYHVHQMTLRCLESSLLHTLTVDQFYTLVRTYPEVAEAVVRALSVRLHWYNHLTLVLSTLPAFERICGMLLALTEHFAVKTEDGLRIDLNLTHATLAAMVGVGRPFLTVTLSKLEKSGHLSIERRRIVIHNPARLEALAFETAGWRRAPLATKSRRNHAPPQPNA
ncbi:MAG: Crp/Fnr family transcriptional regulator [Alphaproteobacteria bacterium]|nr:Crp/Fnr family transcriptional regulator [Alphaproteobacteria bacterium]